MLTLGILIEALTGRAATAYTHSALTRQVLTDAVIDSRLAIPGCLFVALRGERQDGHDFVADAFERGAAVALVEREIPGFASLDLRPGAGLPATQRVGGPRASLQLCVCVEDVLKGLQATARHWRRQLEGLRVIGITGSVGKSTTKELVASVLASHAPTLASESSFNNEIGLPITLLKATRAHRYAVLEMGLYVPGDVALLCDIARPDVGVVTMIGPVHLERAGSIEAIVRGKAELVQSLPEAGVAVLNADDERVIGMRDQTHARVFTYGLNPQADLWASDVKSLGLEGMHFQVHFRRETLHLHVPLLGQHSVHTVLRAAAVGLVEDLTWQEILDGLQAPSTQLRLVTVTGPSNSLIIDDTYNASPDSMIAALNLLQEIDGRHIAVLGDMLELGEYEERGHRMVGARAAQAVDVLVTVGERARWIAEEARLQGLSATRIAPYATAEEAGAYLQDRVREGDVVLVKGSHAMRLDSLVTALEREA